MEKKTQLPQKTKSTIVGIMSAKYHLDPVMFLNTLKSTIMKPGKDGRIPTNEEIAAFLVVAQKYDLDPFTNEIYAYPSKKGGIIPVIGVDGYVSKICNHPNFDGMEISFSADIVEEKGAKPCPEWCEVKLYRKGIGRPIIVREYFDEVYRASDYVNPWKTHTKRMLRHKTIIQAGRVAGFMVGIYDEDEAQRILEAEMGEDTGKKPEVTMPEAIEAPTESEQPSVEMSTPAQQKAIHTIGGKLEGGEDKLYEIIWTSYGKEGTKELTKDEASKLMEYLQSELDKMPKGNTKK